MCLPGSLSKVLRYIVVATITSTKACFSDKGFVQFSGFIHLYNRD